jgi:GNAT superfamily N-acetyltransferase
MSKLPAIDVRPIGLDNLSELRHLHSQSYRSFLGPDLSQDRLDSLLEYVRTPAYLDQILQTECLGAWINARLCATGNWMPGGAGHAGAKIAGLCVDPLFSGLGLGTRIVSELEARGKRAGFAVMSLRAPLAAAAFFERLGYVASSRGVWSTACGVSVPVMHMRKGQMRQAAAGSPQMLAADHAAHVDAQPHLH